MNSYNTIPRSNKINMSMFWFHAAKFYSQVYSIVQKYCGFNLRGIGFLLRKIKVDHVFIVEGKKIYFNHKVAACYIKLIGGKYSEPETHVFIRNLISIADFNINFFDVGSNIGEMIVDAAGYSKIVSVIGFEPNQECIKACKLSVNLNQYKNTKLVQKALNADGTSVEFLFDKKWPVRSGINLGGEKKGTVISASTLDIELLSCRGPAIILIDVEGAEALVLEGGKHFIKKEKPLIIFEYHELSKRVFDLNDIRNILGVGYAIYRLRKDGRLDKNYDDTWNCVAVHFDSPFYKLCQTSIVE